MKRTCTVERELLKLCLEAFNDIPRKRFREWFRGKFSLNDTYDMAAKLERYFRGEA